MIEENIDLDGVDEVCCEIEVISDNIEIISSYTASISAPLK